MSNNFKDIYIKNHTCYFFDDIINIKTLDLNKIKIDQKSYKNIIYYIGYMMIKDSKYLKIKVKLKLKLKLKSFIPYDQQNEWML